MNLSNCKDKIYIVKLTEYQEQLTIDCDVHKATEINSIPPKNQSAQKKENRKIKKVFLKELYAQQQMK